MQGFVTRRDGHSTQPSRSSTPAGPASALRPSARLSQAQPTAPTGDFDRNTAAAAARVTLRTTSRNGHIRDASLNARRSRLSVADSVQNTQGPPFWDGSTIDGSMFSETASDGGTTDLRQRMEYLKTGSNHRRAARQRPMHGGPGNTVRAPFAITIGDNGMIDEEQSWVGSGEESPTPDGRAQGTPEEGSFVDDDSFKGEPEYEERTVEKPSRTLNHHSGQVPSRRQAGSERAFHRDEQNEDYGDYYEGEEDDIEYVPAEDMQPEQDFYRSTLAENGDASGSTHQEYDSAGDEQEEQERTPKQSRTREQIKRQVARNSGKDKCPPQEIAVSRIPSAQRISASRKRPLELDYDDNMLAQMDYSALKSQAFDYDPAQAESQSASAPPQGALPDKLQHFLHKDQAAQSAFFAGMPVQDWNDSGDWFLEKFGDVMKRLREARQQKRQLVEQFEDEINQREKAVKSKISSIGQNLEALKKEGDAMMRGKLVD